MNDHLETLEGARPGVDGPDRRSLKEIARAVSSRADLVLASAATNILSLAMPIVILQIYDRVIPNKSANTLVLFILGLGCVLLLDAAFGIGRSYLTGWSAARLQHILGVTSIRRVLGAELAAIESMAPGMLLQRMRAIDTLKSFYAGQAMLVTIDLPFIVLFLAIIALIGRELALFPLAVLILALGAALVSGRALRAALEERVVRDERRQNFVVEVLSKIPTVKALGLEALLCRRYERLQAASAEMSYWVTYKSSLARTVGGLFSQITMACVAGYGSTMVIDGALSVGSLAACTFLAGRSAQPMLRALGLWTQFQSIAIATKHVTSLLEIAQEQPVAAPAIGRLDGAVELSGLAFGYGEDPRELFDGLDLTVRAGECVAITGANGAGKTTLLHLVSGLLVPTAGRVAIDGKAPRHYDLRGLRAQICHIPQFGTLFHGTILENLTGFGDEVSVDRAIALADRLGLNAVASRLPKGFETHVGEGANDVLPSGIRQLICIVRAFAKSPDPPIILFDEANSQLDRFADDRLIRLLESFRGRSTLILVSHRPSYFKLADRLFMLNAGRLEPQPLERRSAAESDRRGFAA